MKDRNRRLWYMSSVDASDQQFQYIQHSRPQTNRMSKTELSQGESKLDVYCSKWAPNLEKCTSAGSGGNVCTWLKDLHFWSNNKIHLCNHTCFASDICFRGRQEECVNRSTDKSRDKLGWDASELWRIVSSTTHSARDGSRFPKDTPNHMDRGQFVKGMDSTRDVWKKQRCIIENGSMLMFRTR